MKLDRYLELSKQLEDMERSTEEKKRTSYTAGNESVLHNFTRDGEIQGVGAMQNWLGHFLKQVAAIVSYVKYPDVEPSESLASRAGDVRTYMKLLVALAEDEGRVTGLEFRDTLDGVNVTLSNPCKESNVDGFFCSLQSGHSGLHESWGRGVLYNAWP